MSRGEHEEFATRSLEGLRARLLDLSGRNQLLNFSHREPSKTQIRIVDEVPELLFRDLLADKQYQFRALPDAEPGQESWTAAQIAAHHGIAHSYDLPRQADGALAPKHKDAQLQTLLSDERMERCLEGIRSASTRYLQELGVHTLHACFGFLRWYESDSSEKALDAPLVLVPVTLERKLSRGKYVYSLRATGDEPETNSTLRQRLRRDFGLELPTLAPGADLGDYLDEVQQVVASRRRWMTRRWVTMAIVRFERVVMYEDLTEDAWGHARPSEHSVLEQLLVGSESTSEEQFGEVPDLDQPSLAGKLPYLITDADASQTAAIMDALEGRNLVIQGPPGTGKSQTITNLVAAALAQGKKVLFVAQKAAAVDVVRDRLQHAGLGEFVLSLHSTSASKAAVYESIAQRLALRPGRDNTSELRARIDELRQQRDRMNEYLRALNTPFGALGKPLHELLWTYDLLRDRKNGAGRAMTDVRLPDVTSLTPASLTDQLEDLRALEAAYLAMRKQTPEDRHPWGDVVDDELVDPSEAGRDSIVAAVREWAASIRAIGEALRGLGLDDTHMLPEQVLALASALERLPRFDAKVGVLLASIESDRDAGALAGLVGRAQAVGRARAALGRICPDPERLIAAESTLRDAFQRIVDAGAVNEALASLPASCSAQRDYGASLERAADVLERVCGALGWHGVDPVGATRALSTLAPLLRDLPKEILLGRTPAALAEKPPGALDEIVPQARELAATTRKLDESLRAWREQDPVTLRAHSNVLANAGWFERWFGGRFKAAAKAFEGLTGTTAPPRQMAAQLEYIAAHLESCRAFSRHPTVEWLARHGVDWTSPALELTYRVDAWAADVRTRLRGLDPWVQAQRAVLFSAPADLIDAVRVELERDDSLAVLLRWVEGGGARDPRDEARNMVSRADQLERSLAALRELGLDPQLRGRDLEEALGQIATIRHLEQEQARDRAANARLYDLAADVAQDPSLGEAALRARSELEKLGLPESLRRRVFGGDPVVATSELRDAGARLREFATREHDLRERAWHLGVMANVLDSAYRPESLASTLARLEPALQAPETLASWLEYCGARREVRASPAAAALLEACDADRAEPIGLARYFEWLVYRDLADRAADSYPQIRSLEWSGDRLSATRRRFAELDREVLELQRAALRNQLANAPVPAGNSRGPKSEWTDGALLQNEASKQKRHIPIRELVKRAGKALTAIKPCFMMSPLSVAQFLPPHSVEFDLLIIDEASQMNPEDACGAILRAKQVVIVGDNKQLPPTNFFGVSRDDADGESEEDVHMESILDWAATTFRPVRDLRWHYRSRHESLIAFSNTKFYGDRLTVFPSPEPASAGLGVQWRFVEGAYKSSVNEPEARRVVEEALRLMDEMPDRSLGVVAMNTRQAELISELLDEAILQRGRDDYREQWNGTLNPFFVRSLESVQGDERDTILISMTYGPESPGGKVLQRFGPINGQYGHRRLNVLFTRARERVVVVSSMKPTDVIVGPGKSAGVHALRDYLEYAASGGRALTQRNVSTGSADSPFETAVAGFLRQVGYDVAHQVGVRGFSIDLAIRDPRTGGFICGIECDGATYHSARSARDRDRLRQEILENLGWRIVRVWSTDWFRSRESAQRSLLARIKSN